jgi:exosome complex component RRP41
VEGIRQMYKCRSALLGSVGWIGRGGVGETSELANHHSIHCWQIRTTQKILIAAIEYRRTQEMQTTIANAFSQSLFTHLYPHSTILLSLHILSQDGSLLAALLNASTLALIDAGIPMRDYICACTAGSTSSYSSNDEKADPLLDLNNMEEQELPFLTVATLGDTDDVSVLVMETRVQIGRLEGMLAVGVDGCKQVREILDQVVRERGVKILEGSQL